MTPDLPTIVEAMLELLEVQDTYIDRLEDRLIEFPAGRVDVRLARARLARELNAALETTT